MQGILDITVLGRIGFPVAMSLEESVRDPPICYCHNTASPQTMQPIALCWEAQGLKLPFEALMKSCVREGPRLPQLLPMF